MLLAKSLCVLMKVVSHLSHTKPSLMCQLLTFLSAQLQNMAVWYGGTCKLRRWREYYFVNSINSRGVLKTIPNLGCYGIMLGRAPSLIQWKVSHLWVTITLLCSSSHPLRIEIPSIIRGWDFLLWPLMLRSFCTLTKYYVIPHPKTPVHWAMVHTTISISKCYTHILRKVIRHWRASIISTRKLQVW